MISTGFNAGRATNGTECSNPNLPLRCVPTGQDAVGTLNLPTWTSGRMPLQFVYEHRWLRASLTREIVSIKKGMIMQLRVAVLGISLVFSSVAVARAQVVWSEEFNGREIDRGTWVYDIGGHGFGNGQLEFDTARPENSYLEDGKLVIEARREAYSGKQFTSARMLTQGRFAFRYGSLEARIKMPDTANGIWPAFWMLGNNFPAIDWPKSGEIDIVEIGGKQGIAEGLQQRKINCALHFAGLDGKYSFKDAWLDASTDLSKDFHRYRVSWTPEHMKFFLDDEEFGSWDISGPEFREYHQPFFPILNVAVGGWDTSYTGVSSPDAVTARFPARMYVDWIRLTKNVHTEVFLGKDRQEQGNFGVFSETTSSENSVVFGEPDTDGFAYGTEAALFLWNNMEDAKTHVNPSEGEDCWTFDVDAGSWFGMGVLVPNPRNMNRYSDGLLHFDIKTKSEVAMKVGIKSSRGGEFFLPLGDETSEFGFERDDRWHSIAIPLNRFANIDFETVHQLFMISGGAPREKMRLSIDNIWWEPGQARPTPKQGSFGVYTDVAAHREAGSFDLGRDGDFFIWEKTLLDAGSSPSSKRLSSAPGMNWFGAAFTPNVKYDLSAYGGVADKLQFKMKTTSQVPFKIGMKSGNIDGVGQKWIRFEAGNDPYGFRRDGEWYVVQIPMSDFSSSVDLSAVSQLFQVLGSDGPISDLELADISFRQRYTLAQRGRRSFPAEKTSVPLRPPDSLLRVRGGRRLLRQEVLKKRVDDFVGIIIGRMVGAIGHRHTILMTENPVHGNRVVQRLPSTWGIFRAT